MERKKKNSRRLVSQKDGRVIYVKETLLKPKRTEKPFDPTAWYVVLVKRHKEMESAYFLNTKAFNNDGTGEDYNVEAYAAIQASTGNKAVIYGKIFVRVDKLNRVDVLRKCPLLKGYVKDPSLSLTEHNNTDFARVPDKQIADLRKILEIADGAVEYSPEFLQVKDTVKFTRGILSKSKELKGLEGEVQMVNGKRRVTVILDKIGVFKFTLPVSDLGKIIAKS